jgi:hypothetical protein
MSEIYSPTAATRGDAISAHPHDGGLGFPHPAHCVRQVMCTLMLKLLEPYGANR